MAGDADAVSTVRFYHAIVMHQIQSLAFDGLVFATILTSFCKGRNAIALLTDALLPQLETRS